MIPSNATSVKGNRNMVNFKEANEIIVDGITEGYEKVELYVRRLKAIVRDEFFWQRKKRMKDTDTKCREQNFAHGTSFC